MSTFDLKGARANLGLGLREAAQQFGISASYLSVIENHGRVPRPPIARRIASRYGKQVTDIWPTRQEATP